VRLANIAGRSLVQQNDNVGIGGFIVRGTGSKRVLIRGIGSSLKSGDAPLPGRLADPVVDVRGEGGVVLQQNDNWRQSAQQQEIQNTGIAPSDDNEAAILMNLAPALTQPFSEVRMAPRASASSKSTISSRPPAQSSQTSPRARSSRQMTTSSSVVSLSAASLQSA
jgi:hypothetical protein